MPEEKKYEFWIDSVARKVIEREKELDRGIEVIRTESGIGASGIPHVGSMADATRAYGISLGIEDQGSKNEYIAFSDSLDGLRKVPSGMPDWLEKHIGEPVSSIPDPFGDCHKNYAEHMSSLLIDALERTGVKFRHLTADEIYKDGMLNDQIKKIIEKRDLVGKIIKEVTGQEKFLKQIPYFPVCENCGKIYTTRSYDAEGSFVLYKCDQEFKGENKGTGDKLVIKGCGHEGKVDYTKGRGKLAWKVDFAARWAELKISFEAYGKDIDESVRVNDEICRQVLEFEPPLHIQYEMFNQKGGKKISKSHGNVFTPQVWLRYGTPQSLLLLMFKRFQGSRELDVTDIPKYMDEVNDMSKIYFKMEEAGARELSNISRLYQYINLLKAPKKPTSLIPYSVLTEIAKIMPDKDQSAFALDKLAGLNLITKLTKDQEREVLDRVQLAVNWVSDFEKQEFLQTKLVGDEKAAIEDLIKLIEESENENELQNNIFDIAKNNNVKPMKLFKNVYRILLGADRGPRLGSYIFERGKEEVISKLKKAI